MTAYFDRLGEELQLATERRYASASTRGSAAVSPNGRLASTRTRMRRLAHSRIGRWPTVALVAVVVAGGSAAAAIPLFGGSHRLAGTVPAAALRSPAPGLSGAPAPSLPAGLRYSVPVFPDLEAGDAGWCSSAVVTLAGASAPLPGGAGACAPGAAGALAIVAGGEPLTNVLGYLPSTSQTGTKPGRPRSRAQVVQIMQQAMQHDVFLNWFVVSDRVAAIKINGTTFVPHPDQDLAANWRAVVAFTRGAPTSIVYVQHNGRPVSALGGQPLPPVQVTKVDPRHLPAAVCALGPAHLPGRGSEWEVVATSTPTPSSLARSDVLFSCARAWYAFPRSHAVYSAAILLNAQNFADRAPQLPGLTPGTRPGDFEEAAHDSAEITARRIDNAWLVIQGPSQQQREALLHNISASGSALHN